MTNKIQRAKFVAKMFKRLYEVEWNNPKLARMQFDSMKRQFAKALDDGIIDKENYDELVKAVDETVERKLRG